VGIQSDGKVVAAGRSFRSNFDLTLARYNIEGPITTPDTTPPTAPTGLTATFNATTNTIDLSWTAATDNVGVTGYRIFRDGGLIPTTTPINGTTFSDAGQTGTHSYAVSAVDAAGNESALSNTASATVVEGGGDVTPPTAPAGLTANANLATKTIELSWTASTDDVAVTGYRVFRDNATTPIATVTGTTFNDSGLLGTHVYTVAAIDAAGNQSAMSNSATATITIPEGSTIANLTVNPTTVTAPASAIGTVTLNGAAPAGGVTVTLRSSDTGKATVPPSVTVPEGAKSATFTITTLTGRLGGGRNTVTITATLGSSSISTTLDILRP
jgi:fibronectin type 3 domain-containing protein